MIRILHTADLQLGKIQYESDLRARDFERTCLTILNAAVSHNVDAVVLAGDIFDLPRPPASATVALADGVRACANAGIPVFGIEGNHDVTPDNEWLRTCGVIPLGGRLHTVTGKSGAKLVLAGLNFVAPKYFMGELKDFLERTRGQTKHALVIHQMLAELTGFSGTPLTALEVAGIVAEHGIHTVLMGDVHAYAEMSVGGVRFCQPGSPELTSAADAWPRSVNLLGFDASGVCVESQPLLVNVRPMHEFRVDTEEDLAVLAETLAKEADLPLQPIRYIRYSPALPDVRRRIISMFNASSPYAAVPVSLGGAQLRDEIGGAGETYDRKGASAALLEMLSGPPFELAQNDPMRELITRIMDTPDDVERILEDTCRRAGITPKPRK